ncbi:hypothetical protein JYG23_09000 [Sedimentibacter sp. zth1]|uniref:hypothetical protein n=1 Tax=Sedimentibacter sp. zth1 TaxID=2816908 RepID=UPI001A93887F|nr:hypothetical protein [Sedimentibacter sp. zth1]QSX04840.1 hypothetical protein JYG23_09000 [Sedimentibacter sp. zth1]
MKVKKTKNNSGAIIVEAAFVMPIVIVVVFILIYMALLQIEQSIMYSQAEIIGQSVCKIINFPGFEKLILDESEEIEKSTLDDIYSEHNPYRYLINRERDDFEQLEKTLKDLVCKYAVLNGGQIEPHIEAKRDGLATKVMVSIDYSFLLPSFVKIVGINNNVNRRVVSTTYATDSVEFIRNTDLAFDAVNFLLVKLHLKDKVNVFYQKIKDITD